MKKKVIILFVLVVLLFIFLWYRGETPVELSIKDISKIDIVVDYGRYSAYIENEKALLDVIETLNSIRGRSGGYTYKDLGGRTPISSVTIYDKKGEILDYMHFSYNIFGADGNFYKMSSSEHNKLVMLCKKYGDYPEEQKNYIEDYNMW